MLPGRRRGRVVRRGINLIAAACAAAAVLGLCAAGYGQLPALGRVLDPGHGVWASAAAAELPVSQRLTLPGLARPAAVSFTGQGIAIIRAASVHDAMLALGYIHARFRLVQMDLQRRLAEGRLSQLVGASALPSDRFELRLGLLRTAQREWAAMPRSSPAAQILVAYARGVNDYLAQSRDSGQWPAVFSLAGVFPAGWTPVDSLAVQGDLTQELDYTTTPLDYALLARSLGMRRTLAWFPILPVNSQSPAAAVPLASEARAAAAMLAVTSALPPGQIHGYTGSNAWAANGPKVLGGGSMLGGDPYLPQTLPSVWFQVAMSAPGLAVTGVGVPGLPGVLIGHNSHIAWSLADSQSQSALFYVEKTSRTRPGEYYWRGQWRRMRRVRYAIEVRGGATRHLAVAVTVHGPVLTQAGRTVSVDWMGNISSPDIAALYRINTATDFTQFRAALASWRAPTQDFVYADDRGNIGAISAGYDPIVRHGDPWLPMPGTGQDDVAGEIPYAGVPHVYDPSGHIIAIAGQRPVSASYPSYVGRTASSPDPSYRASLEYAILDARSAMKLPSFAALQTSLTDQLAVRVLPRLLAVLRHTALRPVQRKAVQLLAGWNDSMDQNSAAAAIWWTFWSEYLSATFRPWWNSARVPVHLDRAGLAVSTDQFSLDQVLEHWTLADPSNPAFTAPGGPARTGPAVMRAAFGTAVAHLRAKLGGDPASWAWGRLHARQFPSLTGVPALGYGPRPAGGDPWTVDAADGLPVATAGPSWRMIVRWAGRGRAVAEGIYPGGQSENPGSPWYQNLVTDWWDGKYLPVPPAGAAATGPIRWELSP